MLHRNSQYPLIILIYIRGNYINHNVGCTLIENQMLTKLLEVLPLSSACVSDLAVAVLVALLIF